MHKLAIILLGFLVILMPIGTSNNTSNVNAISDYVNEVDRKQVSVSPLNCNNINVNVNGFNGATLPTALSGLATDEAQAADEGEVGASSLGNGGGSDGGGRPSGSDSDSRFVCINNNNNIVVEGEEPLTCEECFINNLNDMQLQNLKNTLEVSGLTLDSFCEFLSNPGISNDQKSTDIILLFQDAQLSGDDLRPITDCLEALTIYVPSQIV